MNGRGCVESTHIVLVFKATPIYARGLKTFAKARMSGPQIAKKLKRTPRAVGQKTFALGVRFRSVARKAR